MNDDSFSTRLRNLSRDYYQNRISFHEYRIERKSVLDRIDEEFNGHAVTEPEFQEEGNQKQLKPSMLLKTVSFFANTDLMDNKDKPE